MEEHEIEGLIKNQSLACDDKYVQEKIYWERTVRMIVIVVGMLLTLSGGVVAWGFKVSTEVTNNTQSHKDLERRFEAYERQNAALLEQYATVVKNQQEVLSYSKKLNDKLDILINRSGNR